MMAIISCTNLHKTYDTGKVKVHALRGLDLSIGKGGMVAVMGPSGCGKTTLLNCLSGLDSVTEGEVYVENMKINDLSDNKKTEHRAMRMGFVFQFYNLLPVLSALENVELPLLVSGVRPKVAREKALKALDLVGLKDWAPHVPAELSGGERQRVTIARALVNNPAIVWADEPTGDLDKKTSNGIMDLMCRLNKENKQTFVIVTHDPGVAARAGRQIRMEDGKIVKDYSNGDDSTD
ncbi:MAG: ABC transporter ATP-binding protein [Candidatus Thermoplasmatota archaeon]|jgi:putative ABC transport system ATP-binding protein|nr:ABC transporter ATP-binding protein [Candidatus Thermoplasmatota archaeon]MDP7266174.1 ABC transporter ATP-binding protein [Candidatus Thermoplasmatota archaeon]